MTLLPTLKPAGSWNF